MNLRHFLASLLSLLAAPFVRRKEEPVRLVAMDPDYSDPVTIWYRMPNLDTATCEQVTWTITVYKP